MHPPDTASTIFAIDGLDISMFDSIDRMCAHIEPINILSGDIIFYAGDGSRIRVHGSVSAGGEFERLPPTPESVDALRTSLLDHLTAVGKLNTDDGQTLEDLVRIFLANPGMTYPSGMNSAAPKAILLITITLIAITLIILFAILLL